MLADNLQHAALTCIVPLWSCIQLSDPSSPNIAISAGAPMPHSLFSKWEADDERLPW